MRAMFTLMNGARLAVGMQGLGLSEVSYQNAVAYAKDRVQGRAPGGAQRRDLPADPIIVHPDVRRGLLTMRAFNEGARALAYWVGMHMDLAERHPDAATREASDDLVALMTPVIKAFFTDIGFETANHGLQTLGGHGYIREFGMEQYVRDARIGQIYEGTNGVQALDLVGRKLPEGNGRMIRRFFADVAPLIAQASADESLADIARPVAASLESLKRATETIAARAARNAEEAGAAASDYLRLFGYVALGYMWVRMAKVARERLASGQGDAAFYQAKLTTARFYVTKMLPQTAALLAAIDAGAAPLMEMDAAAF
jgi:hypothetical protein